MPGELIELHFDGVIDLHGLTVIPGLFNTHCHLQFLPTGEVRNRQIAKNLRDCVDRGVTNIRDTLCYNLNENRQWKDQIQKGEILGPRIHQAVHVSPIGGTYAPRSDPMTKFSFSMLGLRIINYKLKESGVVGLRLNATEQEVRDAVDRAVDERGADAVKFCDQPEHFMTYKPGARIMSDRQFSAAIDQSIRRGVPTTLHNVTTAGFRQGVAAGVNSLAHLPFDDKLIDSDAELLLKSRTHIEPTLSVGYSMSYSMKKSKYAGDPEIQRLDLIREKTYRTMVEETWLPELHEQRMGMHNSLSKGEMKIGFIDISQPFSYYSGLIPVGGHNLRLLIKNGAASRLGCGNDAGAANCSPASIRHELSMFDFVLNRDDEEVFSAADMLRTATIQSARSMGVDGQFGSIQKGKIADLVVLKGNPLEDYTLLGQPAEAVFIEGRILFNRCGLELTQSV